MLTDIRYEGPLVLDTSIAGQQKRDNIIPAHGNGAIRLSRDRWGVFFATLDIGSWDAVHSVIYQIRDGAPDGPVLREGMLMPAESGWQPEPGGETLRKVFGMPMAFGVPKDALRNGKPYPNANVFAVQAYRRAMLEQEGVLVPRGDSGDGTMEADKQRTLKYQRIEWIQFRLNDTEDDIEILQPRQTLMQVGYDSEDHFCASGPGGYMNHAMTPPVPADDTCQTWCECATLALDEVSGRHGHGQIAPIEYRWNPDTGLYEWTRVGDLHLIPGRAIGETSISRWDDGWVVAARSNAIDGSTVWYRTEDLFAGLGEPTLRPGTWGPRHSYRCADGQLRLFCNDQNLSPHGHKRNPLYAIDVDPQTFDYGEPRVVFDAAKAGLPLVNPFVDMSKLCSPQGNEQKLVFRTIAISQTTGPGSSAPRPTEPEMAAAGLHYATLTFDRPANNDWLFKDKESAI